MELAGNCISTQHSTEELCKAAARRLSDFCGSLEVTVTSVADSTGTATNSLQLSPAIEPAASCQMCSSTNCKLKNSTTDVVQLTTSLNLQDSDNFKCDTKVTSCKDEGHVDMSLNEGCVDVGESADLDPPSNSALVSFLSEQQAYLIPLSDRPDVDTSLLYPPPPPPSPGDALETECVNTEVKPSCTTDGYCYQKHRNYVSAVTGNGTVSSSSKPCQMKLFVNDRESPITANPTVVSSDSEIESHLPEMIPNPFLELDDGKVSSAVGRQYTAREVLNPILTTEGHFKMEGSGHLLSPQCFARSQQTLSDNVANNIKSSIPDLEHIF